MRRLEQLLKKEFLQIFRDRFMIPIIFVIPFVQLLLLSFAANYEVKNIRVGVVDESNSVRSRDLVRHFKSSDHFELSAHYSSQDKASSAMGKGRIDMILAIPGYFHLEPTRSGKATQLYLILDAINGSKAGVASGYAHRIIRDFDKEIPVKSKEPAAGKAGKGLPLLLTPSYWFNPHLDYKAYMVPGILVILVSMMGLFLSSMNIVREKEIGTIEQVNVTPIKKWEFITGKLLPFWIIGILEMGLGLLLGKLIFDIPLEGSIPLVFLFTAIFLFVVLGLGMFISTFTDTQQQAIFFSWFIMVVFILMSGLFTPIESMPDWARILTWFNPVAYMVGVMREVLLKGSGIMAMSGSLIVLSIFAVVLNVLAVGNYRKGI
jgi:ABC-2 type transport system permease protein